MNTSDINTGKANIRHIARAKIKGSAKYPKINGFADFYSYNNGTIISVEVNGLPDGFHAVHIHDGSSCSGYNFPNAGKHFAKGEKVHPNHEGDLPPILSENGFAWSAFFTSRFIPYEVMNRVIIIHEKPDDFRTQPSGDAGDKIACGVIMKVEPKNK